MLVVFGLICPNLMFLVMGDKSIRCFLYRLLLTETDASGGKRNQRAAKRIHGFPPTAGTAEKV